LWYNIGENKKEGSSMEKGKFDKVAYNNQFNAQTYDRINLTVQKGRREEIRRYAEEHGESVNGFINRLIDEVVPKQK
jgi:16S rRNA U516 pseudouridylate synthase RsuA-like enzyme